MCHCSLILVSFVCVLVVPKGHAESPGPRAEQAPKVADALLKAGYEVQDVETLAGINGQLHAARRGRTRADRSLAGLSHLLVSVEPVQRKQSPVGFSLSIGDSDPRSPEFQKTMVTPIRCALVKLSGFREQGSLVQDKQVPRSASSQRGNDASERAYATNIVSVCHALLAELRFPRSLTYSRESHGEPGVRIESIYIDERPNGVSAAPVTRARDETAPSGPTPSTVGAKRPVASAAPAARASSEAVGTPSAVRIERKRMQITILNQGDTLILELANNRR
jgi:hypothetical protein